jgi:hypothetical protein
VNREKLEEVLKQLVQKDKITSAVQDEILAGVSERASDTHRSIFAEIGGYLGGTFVIVAVATFIAQRFDDISTPVRFTLFLTLAIVLGIISLLLGITSAVRARLSSVLGLGSAISFTGSIAMLLSDSEPPTLAFAIGSLVVTFFFLRNRNELLHLATFGYLFLFSLMAASTLISGDLDGAPLLLATIFWMGLSAAWIFLSYRSVIQKSLGYALAVIAIFISTQVQFTSNNRVISYVVAGISALALARLFLLERSWPLLPGAVTIVTFSVGEFVAATLGGSAGALIGLFAAGIALIASSLYAIRVTHK